MRNLTILSACLFCLCARAQTVPITVYLNATPYAQTYYLRYGLDQNALTNQIAITPNGTTNLFAVMLNVDSRKRWYVRQDTYTINGLLTTGAAAPYGPITNHLVTTVMAAPSASGPWTNILTFGSAVDSNQCGLYRLSTFMQNYNR